MPHLAAGPRLGFSIKMERSHGLRCEACPIVGLIAQQICHDCIAVAIRIAERPAGNGADVLLELRYRTSIDGPVAGIVDAGSDLVDEDAFAGHEHLDADDADIVELRGDRSGDVLSLSCGFGGDLCGYGRAAKDMVFMFVFGDVIDDEGAVPAPCRDDRYLLFEFDDALDDGRRSC